MRYEIKIRLVKLGRTCREVIRELNKRYGENVSTSEFSKYIAGVDFSPKCERSLKWADEIISEWETESKEHRKG